jgi:hypothetical protein
MEEWRYGFCLATGYGLDSRGSILCSAKEIFIFSIASSRLLGPTYSSYLKTTEVERPEREVDHSPPPSVEVKNGGAIPPLTL